MSFNVSQHVREKKYEDQPQVSYDTTTDLAPYTTERGINLSELARQKVAAEQMARQEEEESRKKKLTDERTSLVEEYKTLRDVNDSVIPKVQRRNEVLARLKELDKELGLDESDYISVGERAGKTIAGATKQSGSGFMNFLGTGVAYLRDLASKLGGNTSPYAGYATDEVSAANIGYEHDENYYADADKFTNTVQAAADKISESASEDLRAAKAGLGKVGTAAVDIGANLIQMGYDAAFGPGSLAAMFVRSAGGKAQEVRQEGGSVSQQFWAGNVSGGIEVLTEKLADGVAGIYGKGTADEAIERMIGRLAKSDFGRTVLRQLTGAASEGVEEVLSDLLNPFVEIIYKDKNLYEAAKDSYNLSDMLYDFIIGAAVGAIGGGASLVLDESGNINPSNSQNVQANQQLSYTDTARDALINKGFDAKNAQEQAENIARQMMGEDLTPEQQRQFDRFPTAQEVYEQIKAGANPSSTIDQQTAEEAARNNTTAEATGQAYLQQVVNDMDVSEADARVLLSGYETGDANPQEYARGIQEAYKAGTLGVDLAQAQEDAVFAKVLNNTQFAHAWQIGAQKAGLAIPETTTRAALPASSESTAAPSTTSIEEFSRKFDNSLEVARLYDSEPSTDLGTFTEGFQRAYDMGLSGVGASYLTDETIPGISAAQRQAAYDMGKSAADTQATAKAETISQSKKTGGNQARVKGTVKGEGVTIADMKKAFNDRQNTAYRLLTRYAETTGVNIVLYNSKADAKGAFPSEQGRFQFKDNAIYVDINSGLNNINDVNDLGKYTMLRTFAHEFTHFIENWNPARYNEFRQFVFETLEARGENVNDLIEAMQARDSTGKMTYEQASREVVADAMMDILPDTKLVQQLAQEHESIFKQLLNKLRDFAARMQQYYRQITTSAPAEAQALKDGNTYLKSIVDMWEDVAKGAVENYQLTFGEEFIDQPARPTRQEARADARERARQAKNSQEEAESAQIEQKLPEPAENLPTEAEEVLTETEELPEEPTVAEVLEAAEESEKPVEPVPPKAETEKAKQRLKKGVSVPVEKSNTDAIQYGLVTRELSLDNITLTGNVHGFNVEQRAHLIDELISAYYNGKETANISVPYDGKFSLDASLDNVVKVLSLLKAKVTQDVVFNKQLDRLLRKAQKTVTVGVDGQFYITNGTVLIPISREAASFASEEYHSSIASANDYIRSLINADYSPVVTPPTEGKANNLEVYKFSAPDGNVLFEKSLFSYFDGGIVSLSDENIGKFGHIMRVTNPDGTVKGFLLRVTGDGNITEEKPSKLKSFSANALKSAQNEARSQKAPEKPKPESPAQPQETKTKTRFPLLQWKRGTPSQKAAYRILTEYLRQDKGIPSKTLYEICDKAFGGTQSEGTYNRKDAYDAMELAVNQFITERMQGYNDGSVENAERGVEFAQRILSLLPTQNVRTQEQLDFQQFSTPPSIAYLAAWAANVNNQDHVLEPSAGIGGLAAFAKAWGAETTVNELSERRYGIIQAMGFDHYFNENAEHIDNVLPDSIQPTVVIMNPPFSSTAGRMKNNKTSNAEKHINSALDRLADGGRLVAIVGRGMADDKYSKYWNSVRQDYTIRANIGIDGKNYTKYGTSFDVQIVVIDKTGPQGDTKTITGNYADLSQVPGVLEAIRNDRSTEVERNTGIPSDNELAGEPEQEQNVPPAVDQGNATGSGGLQSGDRNDTGGIRESGNADIQRATGVQEPVQNAGPSERGAVGQQRPDKKDSGSTKATGQSKGRRADAGTAGTAADVQGESGQQRSGSGAKPARGRQVEEETVSDDGVYATYQAPKLPTTGSQRHPAVLVESAAMAAVDMPEATYKPHLPDDVVKNNLSDAQMVSIVYAGQAHEQKLPSGERRGFFIGDGTGVGKGRQISGIILDNFEQGRKKAVWISEKQGLFVDAQRDWTDTTGRKKDEVKNLSKVKKNDKIDLAEGIVFTTYDTLRTAPKAGKPGKSNVQILAEWFGKDYDGVIAFDEAHNMGNLLGKAGRFGNAGGSDKAKAAVELQRLLPNARVVYVSATAATEVDGLAFASRLGLWGKGTAFTDVKDFVSKIGSSGLSAMELVVRDMKAMGMYDARSISYNGVEYSTVQHNLDPVQRQIYDTMSRAWQKTMQSVEQSLTDTGARFNPGTKSRVIGQYYNSIQRFYNQVLTSMSMPSVIADMKKQLAEGRSCVLQIVNTNQAAADREISAIRAEGGELDDMDLTPRGTLIDYLMNFYPVYLYEEYTDDDGNVRSRPVTNKAGEPVLDKKAVAKRDALIAEVNQMSIPDGPLEMLFDAFGTENVAEITGRTRRVVPRKQTDGSITRVEEKRTTSSREADVNAFQNGDKRILVFNNAGGTGKSYHADVRAKNQQQRVHYVLQPGWEASRAVQGFGRTHRSNEASAPIYKLVTTDIKGQKRFTSTIARRLDQLGALTKGQRDTGSGMFGASDNLETDLAKDSLREFYKRLGENKLYGINGETVLKKLGLLEKFTGEHGEFKMNDSVARDIGKFLNRILALEVDEQNDVFDAFISIYEMEMDAAIQAGTLDRGMENVKADKIEIVDDKVIREQKGTGAATRYVQAKVYTKPKVITTVAEAEKIRTGFIGVFRMENGDVRAVYQLPDKTDQLGRVHKQYKLQSPNYGKSSTWIDTTFKERAKLVPKGEWQTAWSEELKKVPEYNEEVKHMLTGALLPIWDTLPQEGNTKVQRLMSSDGKAYLGRIISADQIDTVLSKFNVNRTQETYTGKSLMTKAVKDGSVFNLTYNRAKIQRSRVSGEWRLEYTQPQNAWAIQQQYPGMVMERINFQNRFFIPMNETGEQMLDKMLENNPVASVTTRSGDELSTRRETMSNHELLIEAAESVDQSRFTEGEKDALRIFRERAERLQNMQTAREDLGKQYKEQQFTKGGSRAEAEAIYNQMKLLDSKIKTLENSLLSLENKDVLKNVLTKARSIAETTERERGQQRLREYRQRRNESEATKKYRDRVRADAETLRKWLVNPSNKDIRQHVPAEIQKTVADFLDTINFASQTALRTGGMETTKADERYLKNMKKMHDAIKHNVDVKGAYTGYSDLPEDFLETFEKLIRNTESLISENRGSFVVNQMSSSDLQTLSRLLKNIKKYIETMNTFHHNAMFQHTYDAGEETIEHLSKLQKSKKSGGIYKFMRFDWMRPSYAFEHFGKGGQSIEHEFREGQGVQAKLANEIIGFAKKTYSAKEVKDWSKETKTFELDNGETVTLPVTHIMSLYDLNKRAQALTHIYGDGIRVANYKDGRNVQLDEGHLVSLNDVQRMISSLSDRQRAVADALQKFMSTEAAKWGNYVSMARFDVEQFTEENYFPINSDGRYLSATADESPDNAGLYALLNSGFTKELKENADNRIILYNIFDVFANHTASMTQYRAFALPVLDALKWFNYQNDTTSVRTKLSSAFGAPVDERAGSGAKGYAESFVLNLLRAYNGTAAQGDPYDSMGMRGLHRFNRAQIAFNARVVIQQPMAVTRAAMILNPSKLAKGLSMSATQMSKLAEEMEQHSGIAAWKALGFYDTNISRGLTELIKQNPTVGDQITEVGTKGAETADRFTWAAMWYAAKDSVDKSKYSSNEAYMKAVTELFEEVIYKTQVVDSVLTKSEFLRAKGFFPRMLGSFMSEPMTTMSMLSDAYYKYTDDMQRGMSWSEAWQRNGKNIAKTAAVYAVGQTLLAAVQAIIDAWRDDDDYATFMEKYMSAFKDNVVDELLPFGKVPVVSELWEAMKWLGDKAGLWDKLGLGLYGNDLSNGWAQYANYLKKAAEISIDLIQGNRTNYTWYGAIYNLLRGAAGLTGMPAATAWREVQDVWNNTVGKINPEKKLKTYVLGEQAAIKYAFLDGHLTEDEAVSKILEKGIKDDPDDAYWLVRQWETGETKYTDVKRAIISGNSAEFMTYMDELTSHGVKEKTVYSQLKSFLKKFYVDSDFTSDEEPIVDGVTLTDAQTKNILTKYLGMDNDEAADLIESWKFQQENGFAYSDRKSEYMSGNITKTQARNILSTYGKMDAAEIEETLASWDFEKQHGWAWSERKSRYQKGKTSRTEMYNLLTSYGGMTPEEAEAQIEVWDWSKNVPGADGITKAAIADYNAYCAGAGVSKENFAKIWKIKNSTKPDYDANGDAVKYSLTKKVMPEINKLPISAQQKTQIALCFWANKTVNKYKLW